MHYTTNDRRHKRSKNSGGKQKGEGSRKGEEQQKRSSQQKEKEQGRKGKKSKCNALIRTYKLEE
jgi:hypothetical protein